MINKNYLLTIFFLLFFSIIFSKNNKIKNNTYNYDVTIHRDNWGVPHIYGETDEDVAFGLAFAHAEDDFTTIKDMLIATRGKVAAVNGKEGAPIDYIIGLLRIWDTVEDNYENISPKIISICKAYADGINRYIEKNNIKIKKYLYPVSDKDIIAGFVFRTPLMFRLDLYIQEIMKDEKPDFTTTADNTTEFSMHGSNVFAIAPTRSEDGHTRIAVNSHQPWEGPVTWYEAHLHSNEGWNIIGGLFPGSPIIFKGHTENIAWSHTVNKPDLVDVYELTINPDNEEQYLLDNEWVDFEIESFPIEVKLLGPIKWTFKRDLLWTKHGPAIKAKHGVYAFRYSGHDLLGQMEQWYKMNKSTNLSEFKEAMQMMQIPMFNTMYADKGGNIFYIYNALIPQREEGYQWDNILPGNKSELIWDTYYGFDQLPQSTNPKSGYLQNCNSSPYMATIGDGNPKKSLPNRTGIETFQTNRAYRANELLGTDASISKEEFYKYKYDTYYSKDSLMKYALDRFITDFESEEPIYNEGIHLLKNWDLGNQRYNTGAALAQLTFELNWDVQDFKYDFNILKDNFVESIKFLNKQFGKIDIPLGDLQIIRRGDKELPLDGGPDVLRAIYSFMDDNKKIGGGGDCFFQMVDWDKNGNLFAESVHQYGSSTLDKDSQHYNDQAVLFSNMQMKPSFINLDNIIPFIKTSYKP